MNKIHITEIDELLNLFKASRIPSNFRNEKEKEQELYEPEEVFFIEKVNGTPTDMTYIELLEEVKSLNFKKYLDDKELITELQEIGNDIEGYFYTEEQNNDKFEKGRWDDVLKLREENLTKRIGELIDYIKDRY